MWITIGLIPLFSAALRKASTEAGGKGEAAHPRGLREKICMAEHPRLWARWTDFSMPPYMDTWTPNRKGALVIGPIPE